MSRYFQSSRVLQASMALMCAIILTACSGQTGKRATQGAGAGAAAGAVGGVVSALVFGGDVGDAMARGAVWGASTGAVSGAIAGSQEDQALRKKEEKAAGKLKNELGEDAYSGLVALAQCKHSVALSYASIARKLDRKEYARAGLWLEALTYADQGKKEEARGMFNAIISADPDVGNEAEAEVGLDKAMQGLLNIREKHMESDTCPQYM